MKLFGSYTSPYVRHCRIALLEEGMNATLVVTDQTASLQQSPTAKVPFLQADDLQLHDSNSILKYLRESSGKRYLAEVEDCDRFCVATTLLDSCTNLFFLERHGVAVGGNNAYLQRQQQRIRQGLEWLESLTLPVAPPYRDSELRIACFLEWALFRQRLTLDGLPALQRFLEGIRHYPPFAETAPHE